jgi:type II secretory pathway component GspD/PulD (secretin)
MPVLVRAVAAILTAFLLASIAFGQAVTGANVDRTLTFANNPAPAGRQEIVNAIRVLTDMPMALDAQRGTLTVSGPVAQVELAAWLFGELDQAPSAQNRGVREYQVQGTADLVARVFRPQYLQTRQQLQEFVNVVRSTVDLQRIFPCTPAQAVVVRGEAARVALAEWLLNALDKPAADATAAPAKLNWEEPDLQMPEVRVTYLKVADQQQLQEIANGLRTVTDLRRMYPYSRLNALVWRGTLEQDALGEWLLKELDAPTAGEYQMSRDQGIVKIARLGAGTTAQALQALVNALRTTTGMGRLFPIAARNAIMMRGSAGQIARAEQMIRERETMAVR